MNLYLRVQQGSFPFWDKYQLFAGQEGSDLGKLAQDL